MPFPTQFGRSGPNGPLMPVQLFLKSRYVGVMGGLHMRFRNATKSLPVDSASVSGLSRPAESGVKQFLDPSLHRDSPLHIFSVGSGPIDRCWPAKVVRTCGLHEWRA